MTSDLLTSRFFRTTDHSDRHFVYDMPVEWWSRSYEYQWAGQFSDSDATVLDAACGIEHPLKFHLLDRCKNTYACDLDPRLMQPEEIQANVIGGFKVACADDFPARYVQDIRYDLASLMRLPYQDQWFDRIFCVSVLEHLKDRHNRFPSLRHLGRLGDWGRRDVRDSLLEFKRVLKPNGLIVLTFDFPRINLSYLRNVVKETGLRFAGDVDFKLPGDAIYFPEKQLHCFRAVLTMADAGEIRLADGVSRAA